MSDYGSVESIKQKIRECVYRTFVDHQKNEVWKYFEGVSASENGEETKLPCVWCMRCSGLLKYNSHTLFSCLIIIIIIIITTANQVERRTLDGMLMVVNLKVVLQLQVLGLAAF